MGETVAATLLDEAYAARRHLAIDRIEPLELDAPRPGRAAAGRADGAQHDDHPGDHPGDHHWAQYELGKLRFRLELVDHLIDLFRLHDSTAIAGAIEQEAYRARREMGAMVTDAQVAAICRMRARTILVERQVACVYATLLLIESDVMAETEFEVFPVEFDLLDGKFGAWFSYWERNVGPLMAAFCRTRSAADDSRLRVACADYVAHVSAATWPRLAPAPRRPVRHAVRPGAVLRFSGPSPAVA